METFSALLAICAGNSPVLVEFPTQRPVTRSFDVFFDLRLNKGLGKQSWGWWFETLLRPLWRHSKAFFFFKCTGMWQFAKKWPAVMIIVIAVSCNIRVTDKVLGSSYVEDNKQTPRLFAGYRWPLWMTLTGLQWWFGITEIQNKLKLTYQTRLCLLMASSGAVMTNFQSNKYTWSAFKGRNQSSMC